MASIRSRSVTSAVRTWPSTIIRRAVAVSNMKSVPMIRRALCAAGPAKRKRLQNASLPCDKCGAAALMLRHVFSLWRCPQRAFLNRAGIRVPFNPAGPEGHVAEWLRNGLQNRVPRFNSGRGLQPSLAQRSEGRPPKQRRRAAASRRELRLGKRLGRTKASQRDSRVCGFQSRAGFVICVARTRAAVPR